METVKADVQALALVLGCILVEWIAAFALVIVWKVALS